MSYRVVVAGLIAVALGSCASSGGAAIAVATGANAAAASDQDYKLGVSDRVRINVYNEPTLSGEFPVNANGAIAVPLIGDVGAVGKTTSELSREIETRLADGYLREPRVAIDVIGFRPFYILGEVNKPGEYPYSSGLTVMNAVATAQGFTYRADKHKVYIKHPGESSENSVRLDANVPVVPGDTIRIGERYF